MTASKEHVTASSASGRLSLAQILEILVAGRLPLRFTAYDGSATGPDDVWFVLNDKELLHWNGTSLERSGPTPGSPSAPLQTR